MWSGYTHIGGLKFETGDECLVTDITQELSAGLEDPSILAESVSLFDTNSFKLNNPELLSSTAFGCDFINECVKAETEPDDELALDDNLNYCGDHSYSSGSDTSSLEQCWSVQNEIDTPPITPPDCRQSPEGVHIVACNDISFISAASPKGGRLCGVREVRSKPIALKILDTKPAILVPKSEFPGSSISSIKNEERIALPPSHGTKRSGMSKEELHRQQARRKQERMIRNRESAYLSRKRKKEHVSQLEQQVQDLTLENQKLKVENAELRDRLSRYENISTRATWRRIPDLPRKTTTLLALVVTVCLNLGSFSGALLDSGQIGAGVSLQSPSPSHHGRVLLWTETTLDDSGLANLTSCPVAINQSESIRLERELRQWIVGGKEVPATQHFRRPSRIVRDTPPENVTFNRKKRRPRSRKPRSWPNAVHLFIRSQFLNLEGLYEAIHRRADTFYLVTFSPDHLLLPAISRNQSSRPKMSVMVPAYLSNSSSEHVEMMQIDCEVTNTQLLSVRGDDIPSHMRHGPRYNNASVESSDPSSLHFPIVKGRSDLLMAASPTNRNDSRASALSYVSAIAKTRNFTLNEPNNSLFDKDSNMDEKAHSKAQPFRPEHLVTMKRHHDSNVTEERVGMLQHLIRVN